MINKGLDYISYNIFPFNSSKNLYQNLNNDDDDLEDDEDEKKINYQMILNKK